MEGKVIAVCSVVGFLGLLSAITGFAAEATRIKGRQIHSDSSSVCRHPRSPAYVLGITAAVALFIAQIFLSAASKCTCCCSKGPHQSHRFWTLALVFFVFSWFGSVVAILLFLRGAAFNDGYSEGGVIYLGNLYCPFLPPGVFAGAAVLSLASITLGIIYHLILTSDTNFVPRAQVGLAMGQPQFPPQHNAHYPTTTQGQGGIATGQSQFPPQQNAHQDPVFVHEDTYARRQFV